KCAKCEFRTPGEDKNGFADCWGDLANASPHMLELYSIGTAKAPDASPLVEWMIDDDTASLFDIPLDGLVVKDNNPGGTAARQRRARLKTTGMRRNPSLAEAGREAIGDEGAVLTWPHFERTTLKQISADLTKLGRDVPELVQWMTAVFERRIVDLHDWARRDY